ncbi:hypothetical protein M9Y10_016166 [Tritrichomonas musculus]|uniref:Protein kinase domain-containing protein n=1 Tax=Tritrichomonas musculus TaxID=1915356 RepID=A0ABR2I5M5_9EUKA
MILDTPIEQATNEFPTSNQQKESLESQRIKDLEQQLANKTRELEEMQKKYESIINEQKLELKRLKDENQKLQKNKEIEIFDIDSIQNYETIEDIGQGSYGKVVKVGMKSIYALKTMNNFNMNQDEYQQLIMNALDHPNILRTFKIFIKKETNTVSILSEYCGMNLNDAIKNKSLSKAQLVSSIYQIAEGMKYLHSQNIIHCNLKPTNIFIGLDGRIKIGDFGMSKLMKIKNDDTMFFMSPEVINNEGFYTDKVDVYSFGSLIFFILSEGSIHSKGEYAMSAFSDFIQQMMQKCWSMNPKERPNFISICEELLSNIDKLLPLTENEFLEIKELIHQYQKQPSI